MRILVSLGGYTASTLSICKNCCRTHRLRESTLCKKVIDTVAIGSRGPAASGATLADQVAQHGNTVAAQRLAHLDELDYIEAAFSAFDLGDEALRPRQALRQVNLGQGGVLARLHQQHQQATVAG